MRPTKPFKTSLIFFASFLGCVILCFLTGYTVDRISQRTLDAMKQESIEKLESSLYTGQDNAWFYYEEAIDRARNIQPDADRENFVYGLIPITPEIMSTIQENEKTLELLKIGAAQPHCSVLFDYRSGLFRRNTNLFRLKLLAQVLCSRSLQRLENGETTQGMEDCFVSLIIAKHIAELSPSMLDQISSVNLLYWGLTILTAGIASGAFSEQELGSISSFLTSLEKDWPPLYLTLEKQITAFKIFIANSTISATIELVLLPNHGKESSAVLRLLLRLRYWRNLFSPRRAFIARFSFLDSIVSDMKEIEENAALQGSWDAEHTFPSFFLSRIAQHHHGNHIPEVFTPKFTNKGMLFNLTRARLLNCAAMVAKYREEKGRYPEDLSGFKKRITIDPNTGKTWQYRVMGDNASLRSFGLSPRSTRDDIIFLMTRKGIAHYLSQKRKAWQHE